MPKYLLKKLNNYIYLKVIYRKEKPPGEKTVRNTVTCENRDILRT